MQLTYVFLILSVITYMFGWVAVLADGSKNRNLSKTDNKLAIFFIILIFITIFIAFGFRHVSASSIDEYAYRRRITTYKSMSFGQALTYGVEWLAIIPTWILSNLTQNTQWILIFTVFVTYALLIIFIKQNSDNFELGVLMIFLINFANYSLNAVQQCEATAILAFGLPYIQKKSLKNTL